MNQPIKILSIDGGGIRGILPATILAYIENRIIERTKNPNTRIADYFDFFIGTSTGAILTSTYLYPSFEGKAKYTATEALDIYLKCGSSIFASGWLDKVRSLGGLWKERYSAVPLEKYLTLFYKDKTIKEFIKPSIITSYDIERKSYHYFQSYKAAVFPSHNFEMRDACRASAAAPTFFAPAHIKNKTGEVFTLVDGAVLANNPSLCGCVEAIDYYAKQGKNISLQDIELYSFGTAKNQDSYTYEQIKDWGGIGWLQPILDIMMTGVSEVTERQVEMLFQSIGAKQRYHRFQPELVRAVSDMDAATEQNIEALVYDANRYINLNKPYLESIIDHLLLSKEHTSLTV
ncbi:MAG: patatin-like phospholipase family protein [Cytophagaceae bacterium]